MSHQVLQPPWSTASSTTFCSNSARVYQSLLQLMHRPSLAYGTGVPAETPNYNSPPDSGPGC